MQHSQSNRAGKEWQYRSIFDAAVDGLIIIDLETGLVVEANLAACVMHGYTRQEIIGQQLTAFVHPDSQNVFSEYIRAFQSDDKLNRRTLEMHRDGSTFYAEWRGSAFNYQGRHCLLGIVRDISKRIKAEQQLRRRVEIRSQEQDRLLEISHTLASTLEFQPGLILDQLREIIEYTHGGLFALEDSALVTLAMRGTPKLEQSTPIRIHLDGPETLAALFNGHRPICIADVWSDTPQAQFLRSLLDDGAAVLLEGMQSWMWVPLALRGRIIGGMGVAETRKNYFTVHHADLALSVANQAAIAMVNAELYGRAQALATLQERQRLAQDLHDAVSQSLFSAGLIAEVLPRLWERDPQEARRSLEDLRRLTRGALAEMRALLAELRPTTLTDTELGDLLMLLGNAFTGRTNIPVIVKVTGQGSLPAETQVAFYRICQETLNNITKHAKASQVEIELSHAPAGLKLNIRDNGCGFVTSELVPSGHYGLGMMRERAEAIGAVLTVTSQPGQGTEIAVEWGEQEGL
ncbi:MAG: PAS domain S-box protein [Anaerolineaceae bacterium]|nr:PAS domain S-box protein [Anaerolineaceae bacterium]